MDDTSAMWDKWPIGSWHTKLLFDSVLHALLPFVFSGMQLTLRSLMPKGIPPPQTPTVPRRLRRLDYRAFGAHAAFPFLFIYDSNTACNMCFWLIDESNDSTIIAVSLYLRMRNRDYNAYESTTVFEVYVYRESKRRRILSYYPQFYHKLGNKFITKWSLEIPPDLKLVATLPWEILIQRTRNNLGNGLAFLLDHAGNR